MKSYISAICILLILLLITGCSAPNMASVEITSKDDTSQSEPTTINDTNLPMIGDGDVISWVDPFVEKFFRIWLGRETGDIFKRDLSEVTSFNVEGATKVYINHEYVDSEDLSINTHSIRSLADLRHCPNLYFVDMAETDLQNLNGAEYFNPEKNYTLSFENTSISDLTPISELTGVKILIIASTNVTDLTPIRNYRELERFDATWTEISDISPLAGNTNLKELDIAYTNVSDLSPLSECRGITHLYVNGTNVTDYSVVSNFPDLESWGY